MTSMASTSQPASSAAAASLGPETSSVSRRETEVEIVRTAVRTGSGGGGRVAALGRDDQVAHRLGVAGLEQRDRVGIAVDDALEEVLAVLVGRQRRLRPAAGLVQEH